MTTEDLSAAIADLVSTIRETHAMVQEIRNASVRQVLTIDEVCDHYLNCARRTADEWARERPWVLPNFGESDIPGHKRGWRRETCEAWYAIPMHVHEAEWFRKSDQEQSA